MHPSSVPSGVALLPRGVLPRQFARIRARLRRRELDAALAEGRDPWSSSELIARAAHLGAPSERRQLATALERLVALAEHRHRMSPYVRIRRRAVLDQREPLLALATRLRDPAPIDVALLAQLALLAWDESSPVFVDGRPAAALAETTARCVQEFAADD
jgi:hypothetical protein